MSIDSEFIQLLDRLVRINSINPWLVSGGAGEKQVAGFIVDWLHHHGVEAWLEAVQDGRPNVIARIKGSGGGKSLCFNAHMDTVGLANWENEALIPHLEGEIMYGLGAADDKGHCALAMWTLKNLVQSGETLSGDVWAALVIDEEGESAGSFDHALKCGSDAVMVLEPGGMDRVIITHQGFGWLDIIVEGRAAHGSDPDKGIDSIVHMAEVITRLHRLDREKYAPTAHPLNAKTVFHTSLIEGGTDYATYPSRCVLGIEIGTQPGETIQARLDEIDQIFKEVGAIYPNFKGRVDVRLHRTPFLAKGHEALLEVYSEEVSKVRGAKPKLVGDNAWGDAAIYQDAGIPTLMLGAAGGNCHAPGEWVSVSELYALSGILERTAKRFCR